MGARGPRGVGASLDAIANTWWAWNFIALQVYLTATAHRLLANACWMCGCIVCARRHVVPRTSLYIDMPAFVLSRSADRRRRVATKWRKDEATAWKHTCAGSAWCGFGCSYV